MRVEFMLQFFAMLLQFVEHLLAFLFVSKNGYIDLRVAQIRRDIHTGYGDGRQVQGAVIGHPEEVVGQFPFQQLVHSC